MPGNSYDRDLAKRGTENSKKKEELKRSQQDKRDSEPVPVDPGIVEKPRQKRK